MKSGNINKKKQFGGPAAHKARQQKKRKKISEQYLYNAGLYYLERFPASVAHFKVVMTRKIDRSMDDHPDQDRAQALEWLDQVAQRFQDLGYLNDRLFARGVITSLRRKGTSKTKILMTMRQKGVDSDLAKEVLHDIDVDMQDEFAADDMAYDASLSYRAEFEAALRYCQKKRMDASDYRRSDMDYEEQQKIRNKYLGRLARQGFSYDVAVKALEYDDEADETVG